jgi:TRAP-type C4-dicarboxylate transport system permease small subunit
MNERGDLMAKAESGTTSATARFMKNLDKKLSSAERWLSSAMLLGVVITILVGVIFRFVLELPNKYGEEISRYLIIGCVSLGISIGVREKAHLGIDSVVNALPAKAEKMVRFSADVISLFAYIMLAVLSLKFVLIIKGFGQASPAMTFLPMYAVYSMLFVGFTLSSIRSLMTLWNAYFCSVPFLENKHREQNLVD